MNMTENIANIYDVFISYSSRDEEKAEKIKNTLEGKPYCLRCWKANANNITTGSYFREKITDAINRARIILFVLSKESIESNWVSYEINTAIYDNKTIFPIIVDPTVFTGGIDNDTLKLLQFKLGCSQYISATNEADFSTIAERIAHDAKKCKDALIEAEVENLRTSIEVKFFPYRFLNLTHKILLLLILQCPILLLAGVNENDAGLFVASSSVALTSLVLFLPLFFFEKMLAISIKSLLKYSNPSALYCEYIIFDCHYIFLRRLYKKRALNSLEHSADLGYKKAILKIVKIYEKGKGVEQSKEIADSYRMKL